MATSATVHELLENVERIRPTIEQYRDQAEADRHLPRPVVDALRDAGLFRMFWPASLGGAELDPSSICTAIEAVARIDAAAGWTVGISQAWAGLGKSLPPAAMLEAGPDVIIAGAFAPPGMLTRVDGGFRLTGGGPFASGCMHATHAGFPAIEMLDGVPVENPATGAPDLRVALVPIAEVTIRDTWNTIGMRGTGSHDVIVTDHFVPEHRVGNLGATLNPAYSNPIYAAFHNGIHFETASSLGVAQAAIDFVCGLAGQKTPAMMLSPLAQRATAQAQVAKAQALVDASRATLHRSADAAVEEAARTGTVSMQMKMTMQLAANFAAEACADAVDLVWTASGTSGVRLPNPLERLYRDIHTLSQHTSKSVARYESTGQLMFGLESDWGIFGL